MINPGRYRHKGTFRIPVSQTVDGLEQTAYVDGGVVFCSAEPLKGREFWEAQAVQQENTVRIKMRYISGVKPEWRFRVEGVDYEITNIIDPELRHRELWLMCKVVE